MTEPVTVTRDGDVAVLTLDNPPVNAMSFHLRAALAKALEDVRGDGAVAAVVIACAGRTFVSGADITEFNTPKVTASPNLRELIAAAGAEGRQRRRARGEGSQGAGGPRRAGAESARHGRRR